MKPFRASVRRLGVLAVVIGVIAVLCASDYAHSLVARLLDTVRPWMIEHPYAGKATFVLLSALSAMAAFFSSAIVVPAAVYAWGDRTTFVLLWIAWLAGGSLSYLIGRTVGREVLFWLTDRKSVEHYAREISADAGFLTILLFQLALPSEVPGYVLGAVRYSFRTYLAVLALAELPFALGAVYLGDSFLERRYGMFVAISVAGLLIIGLAAIRLHREVENGKSALLSPAP